MTHSQLDSTNMCLNKGVTTAANQNDITITMLFKGLKQAGSIHVFSMKFVPFARHRDFHVKSCSPCHRQPESILSTKDQLSDVK